jgi:hypothetical protein
VTRKFNEGDEDDFGMNKSGAILTNGMLIPANRSPRRPSSVSRADWATTRGSIWDRFADHAIIWRSKCYKSAGILTAFVTGALRDQQAGWLGGNESHEKKEVHRIMWNPKSEREQKPYTLYPDLPPEALLVQSGGKHVTVDRDEYLRAQWFWERRPAKLVLSPQKGLRIVALFILLWVASMFIPEQAPATAVVHGLFSWILADMLSGSGNIPAPWTDFLPRFTNSFWF